MGLSSPPGTGHHPGEVQVAGVDVGVAQHHLQRALLQLLGKLSGALDHLADVGAFFVHVCCQSGGDGVIESRSKTRKVWEAKPFGF